MDKKAEVFVRNKSGNGGEKKMKTLCCFSWDVLKALNLRLTAADLMFMFEETWNWVSQALPSPEQDTAMSETQPCSLEPPPFFIAEINFSVLWLCTWVKAVHKSPLQNQTDCPRPVFPMPADGNVQQSTLQDNSCGCRLLYDETRSGSSRRCSCCAVSISTITSDLQWFLAVLQSNIKSFTNRNHQQTSSRFSGTAVFTWNVYLQVSAVQLWQHLSPPFKHCN